MADFNQDFYQGGNYSQGQMGWSNQYQQDQPVYNQQSQYTMMPSQNYSQQYYTDQSKGNGLYSGEPLNKDTRHFRWSQDTMFKMISSKIKPSNVSILERPSVL
jgi:hypothetical protein